MSEGMTIPTCDGRTDGQTDRQTSCHSMVRAVRTVEIRRLWRLRIYTSLVRKRCWLLMESVSHLANMGHIMLD